MRSPNIVTSSFKKNLTTIWLWSQIGPHDSCHTLMRGNRDVTSVDCFITWLSALSYKSLISKRTLLALPQGMNGYQHKPIHNSFSFSAYCWFIFFPIICHEWDGKFLVLLLVCCWFISSPIRGWESLFLHLFLIYCCFSSVPILNGEERIPLPSQPIVGLHPLFFVNKLFLYRSKWGFNYKTLTHYLCLSTIHSCSSVCNAVGQTG